MNTPSTWAEWKRKKMAEFSVNGQMLPIYMANRLAYLGRCQGKICEDCIYFTSLNKRMTKMTCEDQGEKKEFQTNWPACGRFQQKEGKV